MYYLTREKKQTARHSIEEEVKTVNVVGHEFALVTDG